MAKIDRTFCINLDRRPDRWQAFEARLPSDWPFPKVERFSAYDGKDALIVPTQWKATRGAFGCLLSHRVLLRKAVEERKNILIFEDDVLFRPDFSARAAAFVEQADDWDLLFLGGQHVLPSLPGHRPDVRVCVKTQRTQAYAVSCRGAERMLPIVEAADSHIDVYYARAQFSKIVKAFAIHPWVCGQAPGTSDVFGTKQPARTVENYWDEVLP